MSESDIRKWAIAVYWPQTPPRSYWDIDVVNQNGEPTCPGKAVVVIPSRA